MRPKLVSSLLLAALFATVARSEPNKESPLFSWDFGETVQYTLNNIVAADDVWSPDHLPADKSHLDHTFYGDSPPVYPSR
jgi:hypothetical protein